MLKMSRKGHRQIWIFRKKIKSSQNLWWKIYFEQYQYFHEQNIFKFICMTDDEQSLFIMSFAKRQTICRCCIKIIKWRVNTCLNDHYKKNNFQRISSEKALVTTSL